MADHDATAHASPDDQYRETPPGAGYEHTDASVWPIVKFLGWLVVSAVLIHVGMGVVYEVLIQQSMQAGEQPHPMGVQAERLPPVPRLQQFPRNELYEFRLDEESLLQRYGWMNKDAGIVHIPVADAMRLAVERGLLPSLTQDQGQAVQPPGMMPSDASSGRVMERRRQ